MEHRLTVVLNWVISGVGWHCSYCMSAEKIAEKLKLFAHIEYSMEPYTNLKYIEEHISTGKSMFRASHFHWNYAEDNLPYAVPAYGRLPGTAPTQLLTPIPRERRGPIVSSDLATGGDRHAAA